MIYDYKEFMDKFIYELCNHPTDGNYRLIWQISQRATDIRKAHDEAQNYIDQLLMQDHDIEAAVVWQRVGLISLVALISFKEEYNKLAW